MTDRLAEKIRRGDPIPSPIAAILSAATPAVRLGMWYRLRQTPERVAARVISFGNITTGGTGKTPAVIDRAEREIEAGNTVGVLTRGYGSSPTKGTLVSSEIDKSQWSGLLGDEPALLLDRVPQVTVFKDSDRVASARIAVEKHGCDVLLLDDGYQYTRLARDENVLLLDATNPFGNGYLLPRGILREPLSALKRATEFIVSRCDQAADLKSLLDTIAVHNPEATVRKTWHRPMHLRRIVDGEVLPIDAVAGKEVAAVCAIGNPDSFFRSIESLGAELSARRAYPDHSAIRSVGFPEAEFVLTTEKDAARMSHAQPELYALVVKLEEWDTE